METVGLSVSRIGAVLCLGVIAWFAFGMVQRWVVFGRPGETEVRSGRVVTRYSEEIMKNYSKPSDAELRQMLAPARPVLELYDLQRDPQEFSNLAGSAEHKAVMEDLQGKLSGWMHETLDYLPPGKTRPGEPGGREWPLSL